MCTELQLLSYKGNVFWITTFVLQGKCILEYNFCPIHVGKCIEDYKFCPTREIYSGLQLLSYKGNVFWITTFALYM